MVTVTNNEDKNLEKESHVLSSLSTTVTVIQRAADSKNVYDMLSRELNAHGFGNIILTRREDDSMTIVNVQLSLHAAEPADTLPGGPLEGREFNGKPLPYYEKIAKGELFFTSSHEVFSPFPEMVPLEELPNHALVVPVGNHTVVMLFSDKLKEEELAVYAAFRDILEAAINNVTFLKGLKEQKEFSERIIKSVQEGIMLEDSQEKIIFVNPQLLQMLKYSEEELLGQHYSTVASPESRRIAEAETAKRLRGIKGQYEAYLLRKDGTPVPVIVSATPLFEGEEYIGTLTAFTDITSQKSAEEEIRTLKEFSENIIHSMHEAIIMEDTKGIITFVNPRFGELLERENHECIGCHWREFIAPEYIPKVEEESARRAHGVSGQYEVSLLTKSGRRVPIMVGSTPLFENGIFRGVISVCVDLTVVKEKEKEIKQMNQDLQLLSKINHTLNKGEYLKTILDMAAHELRNIFDSDAVAIMFVGKDTKKIYVESFDSSFDLSQILGISPEESQWISFSMGKGSILEMIVKKKESYLIRKEEFEKVLEGTFSPEQIAEIRTQTQIQSAAMLPLVVEDEGTGILVMGSRHELSQNDFNRLKSLSKHLALAIDHARLDETFQKTSQDLQTSLSEQTLLRELLERLYMAQHQKDVVEIVAEGLTQLGYEYFVVGLREEDWIILLQMHTKEDVIGNVKRVIQEATGTVPDLQTIPMHEKETMYKKMKDEKKAIVTDNIVLQKEKDAVKVPMTGLLRAWVGTDTALQQQCADAMGMQSAICIPLQVEKEFAGVFVVGSKDVLTYHDFVMMETLGQITSEALGKLQYSEVLRKKSHDLEFSNKQLSLLQEINNALNSTTDLEEILEILVRGINSVFDYTVPSIYLLSNDKKYLLVKEFDINSRLLDSITRLVDIPLKDYKIPLFEGSLLKQVMDEGAPYITSNIPRLLRDYTDDERLRKLAGALSRLGRVGWIAVVPLIAGDEPVGILAFGSKKKVEQEDINNLSGLLNQAALAIAKAKLYEELKEANQMKSEFIDIASHELKTPLTSIMLYLEMMEKGRYGEMKPEQKEKIELLQASAKRLQEIIDRTLVSSRIRKDELDLWKEEISLISLVNEVVAQLSPLWERKKQRIDIQKPYKLPLVEMDKNKIWEVINALLDNAIKYSDEGTKITIKLYDRPSEVEVAVMDEGIGIPQEYLKKIFDPFFIVPAETQFARPDGRTGLGLFNAKGIVEKHGGRIWVESVYMLGSTFHFALPK
jgi:PAS domain S-box-containing protein